VTGRPLTPAELDAMFDAIDSARLAREEQEYRAELAPRPAMPASPPAALPLPHDVSGWDGDVYDRPAAFDAFGAPAEDGGAR
jgi:hypothetical protein